MNNDKQQREEQEQEHGFGELGRYVPAEILNVSFPAAMRGYDRHAVDAHIKRVNRLIAEVKVTYKGQLRLGDSPLQVTIWVNRLRAVDFTLGYEVRSVLADPDSKPAVIGESQLAAFDIEEQKLVRLAPHHREYLQRYQR